VAGSSKITDGADNVFTVWSARKEEGDADDDKPDCCLELQKQRNGDVQHKKVWLYFNRPSMQFCPSSDRRAVPVVSFNEASPCAGADARPWGARA
jgi:twinkle protein